FTQNGRLFAIILTVVFLLLIPLVAMQFTSEVNWDLFDFIVAGVLLLGTGLACELTIRLIKNKENRFIIIIGILAALLLVWIELAVGIFGTPFAGS
ncbi:MAG: hypothetical protein ACXWV5_02475, partial [Flavitalea sp.]